MNLLFPADIKKLLNRYETHPSKALGQNFLIDKNILNKIIQASNLKPDDTVLEIGPGIGTLTQELAKHVGKIIAIEKDKTMVEILKETLSGYKNIKIINADILKLNLSNVDATAQLLPRYKVVANIPYYITAPLIRFLLEAENRPDFMVLMVQKEVAQRICASPPNMSLLAVSVQFYCLPPHSNPSEGASPKIVSYVSKNCFWPVPKVDSAIIKITPHKIVGHRESHNLFFKVVKAGFSHPRKQLGGNLSAGLKLTKEKTADWLKKNNLNPKQRAETLSVNDWKNLAKTVDNF